MGDRYEDLAKQGALRMATAIELDRRREEIESVRVPHPFELLPAPQFLDRDSGRPLLSPDAPLVYIGRYFRRSRAYSGLSQDQLAGKADVSQSMVSRVERGRAPGMAFDRFVDMCLALGRLFPFGVCPHDHRCGWQPIAPPAPPDEAASFIELLRRYAGDD
jgi:DNA-binding XRE family transcriptional regulator